MFGKIAAVLLLLGVGYAVIKEYVLIIVGILVLLLLIRWGADIFWWWKDRRERW